MVLNLNHKEKMQEGDIGLTNCVHMTATRLIKYVPIVVTTHVETCVLLSKLKSTPHIEVEINLDEMDLSRAESKATYEEIKEYVLKNYGMNVTNLYIAQVKRKYGIIERINYNLGEGKTRVPQVTAEKEEAIEDALRHFQMIS